MGCGASKPETNEGVRYFLLDHAHFNTKLPAASTILVLLVDALASPSTVFLVQSSKKPKPKTDPAPVGKPAPEDPDVGLSGSHQFIKFLGSGGTGETHLYRDRATGEEVAIKCVKRPIPKVVQPNLLREIRVRF